MTTTSFTDRAQRGYDWLASDEAKRLGFDINLLNPDLLDLSDVCGCVLGETYQMGSYWDAIDHLFDEGYSVAIAEDWFAAPEWEQAHGFLLTGDDSYDKAAYAELTDAWRQVIKKERDQ